MKPAILPPDEFEEDRSRLLALAGSGLATGALAGLVGSAFHFALGAAERSRNSLLDWAHGYPALGWLAPVLLAAGAAFVARWLVWRYAPETSGSGVQRVKALLRGGAPVTGIALVVEMTGATTLLIPLLTACASALAVPALLDCRPIYDTLRERDTKRHRDAVAK